MLSTIVIYQTAYRRRSVKGLDEVPKVTITVKGRKPAPASKVAPRARRFGPFARPEEDLPPASAAPQLQLVDTGMRWTFFADDSHLDFADPPYPSGIMAYLKDLTMFAPELDEFYIGNMSNKFSTGCFTTSPVWLPANFMGTAYRQVRRAMPLPELWDNGPVQLKVNIGGRPLEVKQGSDLKKSPTAQMRLEKAMAADPPDAGLIAALEKEVAESSFAAGDMCRGDIPDPLANQYWFVHSLADQRALWRDGAYFTPKIRKGRHRFSVECPLHFEGFDPFDTENFKVVKRFNPDTTDATFDSDEVPCPKLAAPAGAGLVRVYLTPQLWKFEIAYTIYGVDVYEVDILPGGPDHEPFTYVAGAIGPVTKTGYVPALSGPLAPQGWATPPDGGSFFPNDGHPKHLWAYSNSAWDPADTSPESILRLMVETSDWYKLGEDFDPDILDGGPYFSAPPPITDIVFNYSGTDLVARYSATLRITQTGCPAEMLVGALEFGDSDDDRYFVYRKTARAADAELYNGPFNHVGYSNADASPAGVYLAPQFPISSSLSIIGFADDGVYPRPTMPDPAFTWQSGGLCGEDGSWPILMRPHWLFN